MSNQSLNEVREESLKFAAKISSSSRDWPCKAHGEQQVEKSRPHLVRILTGDPGSDDMATGAGDMGRVLKIDGCVSPRRNSIHHPDILDPVQGDPHGNLRKEKKNMKKHHH